MAKKLRAAAVQLLDLLKQAPAFPSDVAIELNTTEALAIKRLRLLQKKGLITRRRYYHDTIKEKWLYLLPEHQQLIKGR
jgi:predicted transcriptional regulator